MDELHDDILNTEDSGILVSEYTETFQDEVLEQRAPEEVAQPDSSRSDKLGELEWMYFQSFGQKALLTREGEAVLGKRIEHGDRSVRRAIRKALAVLREVRLSEVMKAPQADLKSVLQVSGLSATELEKGRCAFNAGTSIQRSYMKIRRPVLTLPPPATTTKIRS